MSAQHSVIDIISNKNSESVMLIKLNFSVQSNLGFSR